MNETPAILKLASKISVGDWRGFTEHYTTEQLSDGADLFCHAALLAENSVEAAAFMDELCKRLLTSISPDMQALLQQTWDRLQTVRESGGWLAPTEDVQTEEPIVNTFPNDVFPPMLERYCNSVARSIQVDRAMIGAAMLATSALCMQGRYMVAYPSGNGHREHLCLYIVIVGNPGERKTSAFDKALVPVRAWQDKQKDTYKQALAEFKTKHEAMHSEAEAIKRKMADKKTKNEDKSRLAEELTAIKLEEQELTPPVSPEIIAGDVTVEALSSLMELTGETAGIFTDEADFFKIIAGLYNKGQTGNIGLALKAYDGTPFSRIRGSGTVRIHRPLLSMCLFAQPVLFAQTQDNADLQGRGMMGRLLFCKPDVMAGKRNVRCSDLIDTEAQEAYKQLLIEFLDTDQKEADEIPVIGWEHGAASYMLDYLQKLEDSMQAGNPMEAAADYASKAGGAAIRIAGILHLLWAGGERCITKETAGRAIKLHSYFFVEKLRDMQNAETHEETLLKKVSEKLWELTIAKDRAYTTASELQQRVKKISGLHTTKELAPVLEMIQEKNMIELHHVYGSKKRILYVSPYFRPI